MSQLNLEEKTARNDYKAPYSHNHPIPTVQKYREHRSDLQGQQEQAEKAQHTEEDDSKGRRAFNSVKAIVKNEDKKHASGSPYPTSSRNEQEQRQQPGDHDSEIPEVPSATDGQIQLDRQNGHDSSSTEDKGDTQDNSSATEKVAGLMDPKQKRKEMKHHKRDDGGREVTDPVTHLPLVIRDSTEKDLRRAPENEVTPGVKSENSPGLNSSDTSSQIKLQKDELQGDYDGMQKLFPPPSFDNSKKELTAVYHSALTAGLTAIIILAVSVVLFIGIFFDLSNLTHKSESGSWWNIGHFMTVSILITVSSVLGSLIIFVIRGWLEKKVEAVWKNEIWEASRSEEDRLNNRSDRLPESVAWINSILASVWPLINPDLFTSVVDMLEDVMQASLPKIIRMVSVDDLGQGSEAIRILGIRWLPTAAAGQSVGEDGNLEPSSDQDDNDRAASLQEEEETDEGNFENQEPKSSKTKEQKSQQKDQEERSIEEGMEAEQGDFVNMELAFSYRARSSGKSIKSKAKNAHLYLKFYLPGGIFVPVWVELRGIIGTMRVRLQLTPDPPFFSLCTLTFLGQPRADLSCVPLSKHLPNLMDVPLISSFVQSSIDAALAEYVAPKSLTLDLKDMLVGDDFKKDTVSRGVIVIFIKEAKDFKEGDGGVGPTDGSSDSYITCSWGKFGKTVSSTRIIEKDQSPKWHEWAYMLVTSEELNAEEKLRLQLWDSDKLTADDDLGRVEVDLKELMHNPKTQNRIEQREDRFVAQDPNEKMPGTLSWSVGYFSKTRITEEQLSKQTEYQNIKTKEELKRHVSEAAEKKLREATAHDESKEIDQQKAQDYGELENALICSSPPDFNYPSGVLSIHIHNITGLEVEQLQKRDKNNTEDREDEVDQTDDLPSSYCTIILDHKKVFMTRTKPKNSKPFFNAGTERFVRDWRNAEVMISVKDSRERENDALLGVVYLPLSKLFKKRSQVMDMYPLVGGIGFGRARISLIFRSVEIQMPKELLGWDLGTLEIKAPVKAVGQLPDGVQDHRIKLRSNLARVKMIAENGEWHPKKKEKKSLFIACRKRYSMPLIIEFRKSSFGFDSTPAFAVFWLKDIPDEEERGITLQIWKGGDENLKRATTCAGYHGLEDGEQPLGEIEVTMKFWRGLSGYHKKYAQTSDGEDMRNVMEILDTVNDEIQDSDSTEDNESDDSDESEDSTGQSKSTATKSDKLKTHTNDSSSDSESDEGESRNPLKRVKKIQKDIVGSNNNPDDGSRGAQAQLKDYKAHHRQLHRKHRGVMQWKAMRTADWALDTARQGKSHVSNIFQHKEKTTGIETEV